MLYIFDISEQLQAVLKNDGSACPYYDAEHNEKLDGENTFTFSVPADHSDAQYVAEGVLVAFKDLDDSWQLFEIKRVTDSHEDGLTRTAFCEHSYYELIDDFIEDVRPYDVSAQFALTQALSGTRWSVGDVADLGLNSVNFYYESALSAVQKIASAWGGELRFRVVVEGGIISARYVDLLVRRGADTGKQFVYSKDLKSIEREVDMTTVATALYGRGKGVEVGEGYSRRTTFADVVWSVASGDPVDKPAGQEWVGDPEALARWGRPGGRHRFGVFEDPEETDPAVLLQKTWGALQGRKSPLVTYRLDVVELERIIGYEHEKVRLGDTVRVIDRAFSPPLLVEARVIEINRDLLRPENTSITLGNFAPTIADENLKVQETIQTVRDRQGVWDTGGFSGPVPTSWLDGVIDTLQNEVMAGNGSVTITGDNGILIVDDQENPAKALRLLGGMLAISNEKDPVTGDWVWRAFGTGDGFTADLLNAGQIKTNLVQIIGNSHFYWDGDYLYIVNPDDGNQQIRLSKEGIRFTRDGGQTWLVAMDFDGIRMEGQSQDGYTHYTGDGVKVYDDHGNLVGRLGSFVTLGDQTAAFSRASVAYKSDGTQVAAGAPRFERGQFGQAVMMEEGTTNLVSNGSFESLQGGQYPWGDFTINVSTDTSVKLYGKASQKHIVAGTTGGGGCYSFAGISVTAGNQYSVSVSLKGDHTIQENGNLIYVRFYNSAGTQISEYGVNDLPLATSWQRHKATVTAPTGAVKMIVNCYVYETVTIWADGLLVENKPYSTTFIDSTRAAETLTIPVSGVMNPKEGAVECWVYVPDFWVAGIPYWRRIWGIGGGAGAGMYVFRYDPTKGNMIFGIYDDSGVAQEISAAKPSAGWHAFAARWSAGEMALFVDGIKIGSITNPNLPSQFADTSLYVGSSVTDTADQPNTFIDDLRISSRARTDEEIAAAYASGQPLGLDDATTYLMSMDGTLLPTVRRYGLWSLNGEISLNAPPVEGGIRVRDANGNLRTHIGQYAAGKYGILITNGELYSTLVSTRAPGQNGAGAEINPTGAITIYDTTGAPGIVLFGGTGQGKIGISYGGTEYADILIDAGTKRDLWIYFQQTNGGIRLDTAIGAAVWVGSGGQNYISLRGGYTETTGNLHCMGMGIFDKGLQVTGSKNAIQDTKSYGQRLLYVRESPDCRYVDEGFGSLTNGECRIALDPIFAECIEPHSDQSPWYIHVSPYADVDLFVAEIGSDYFIVRERGGGTTTGARFAWSLSAVRVGYAGVRLPPFEPPAGYEPTAQEASATAQATSTMSVTAS